MRWYQGWFGSKERTEHETEPIEVEEEEIQEEVVDEEEESLVELQCKGEFTFVVEENEESLREWRQKMGHWVGFTYHSHYLYIDYKVSVTYNNDVNLFRNKLKVSGFSEEANVYEYIFDLLKNDDWMDGDLHSIITNDIIDKLEEHLKEKNVEKMRELLSENNTFDIDFTIKTEKTKNM